MIELGWFLLGFFSVFFGGLYIIYGDEIFDMYDDEE